MGTFCRTMGKSDRKPQCVVISGIDGSGKTTVINALRDDLNEHGIRTAYVWLRFNHYFAKAMHALARLTGLSVKVRNEMGEVWQHRFYKSPVFCKTYVVATYIDTWISRLKYSRAAKGCDVVICDRWITDIIVDLATKTHRADFADSKWARRFLNILPENALLFVVYRDTEDIVGCRMENRVDPDFLFRLRVYECLRAKSFVFPVDNRGKIADSIAQIKGKMNL